MKRNELKKLLPVLTAIMLMVSSCEKTIDEPPLTVNNLKGMFVPCEGIFGQANGEISFYDSRTGQTTKSLFHSVNGVAPGDVVQAFEIADTLGFIVVNNSQKVIVVNMKDFRVVKTIDGFSYPRSVVRADDKSVYVSNGNGTSDNYISRISLSTLEITGTLTLNTGPERLIAVKSKVFAAISGGWNNDGNTVIEIDPVSFTVINTYTVASIPVDIVSDKDNNIWAYCKGIPDYTNWPEVTYSGAGLSRINTSAATVTTFAIDNMASPGINNIAASRDGSTIYYLNDALYSLPVTATSLTPSRVVDQLFYGVEVDPQTGNIVCLDAVGSRAVVYNAAGIRQFEFETAKFPNSVTFSY